MEVKLDLHIHSEHSPDGRMALDEIVACARARGLQGVAVCDHDRALTETWDAPDFLLIPGIELSTDQGHLLGLFVTEQIEARELDAAIDAVHACGGLAVMAHPFERSCDAQRLDAYLDRLDGIEVWNGRADRKNPQANAMACALAQRAQKPVTASSDAHLPEEIGNGVVTLEVDALTLPAVRAALLRGATAVDGRRGKARYVADQAQTHPCRCGRLCQVGALCREVLPAGYHVERGDLSCLGSLKQENRAKRSSRNSSCPQKSTMSATPGASSACRRPGASAP